MTPEQPKLLDRVRAEIRTRHYSRRTGRVRAKAPRGADRMALAVCGSRCPDLPGSAIWTAVALSRARVRHPAGRHGRRSPGGIDEAGDMPHVCATRSRPTCLRPATTSARFKRSSATRT